MTTVNLNSNSAMTAGRVLVAALRLHSVERVFCVPGESYLEVLDALHDEPQIELIVAKHEGGAACMAEADGKLTGRPGICMVTRGPGATHASIGIHIAQQDSTPLILFVGQIAREHKGREAFQEVDYQQLFGSMAKLVIEVDDANRMSEIVARAFSVATSGRPGPVVIALPEDMLVEKTTKFACTTGVQRTPSMDNLSISAIGQYLNTAKRPLVIVGGSCWTDEANPGLSAFLKRWKLPAACSFRRQDVINNNDTQYVGHLSLGMSAALKQMVSDADLILAIGTRLGDVATDSYTLLSVPCPLQTLIHCHPDSNELGRVYQPDLALQLAPSAVIAGLDTLEPPKKPVWSEWTSKARHAFEAFTSRSIDGTDVEGVDLTEVMLHLSEALPPTSIISNGAGNYSVWLHRYYRYKSTRTELATTCGSMGYGLPAAIAAALRHKDRPVICVAGDGCFMMYAQELATAVEYGASLIVLVVNNGMYGTIRMHQEKHYPGRVSGTRLKGPDYVALALAFGAHGEQVRDAAEFPAAFERARSAGGVSLIELVTDPLQITPSQRLTAA
jgi:acetolactate synthase-1/2/3 large subunit